MQAKSWKRMLAIAMAFILLLCFATPSIQAEEGTEAVTEGTESVTEEVAEGTESVTEEVSEGTEEVTEGTETATEEATEEENEEGNANNGIMLLATGEEITATVTQITSTISTTNGNATIALYDNAGNTMKTYSETVQYYTSGNRPTSYYYLIPVSYLEDVYGEYNYTFDDDEVSDCSFTYTYSNSTYTASYVKVVTNGNTTYYLQVRGSQYDNRRGLTLGITYTKNLGKVVTDTVSPSGTVINLFDYWLSESVDDRYKSDSSFSTSNPDQRTLGINKNHALKFSTADTSWTTTLGGAFNVYTGSKKVYSGIVASLLGSDGYPYLSSSVTNSSESLAYLFDPDYSHNGKASYSNVTGLLQIDDEGYYYYDCKENYAEFDASTNSFILYDDYAVTDGGQFFPFNEYDTVTKSTSTTGLNHYFGMTLTTRFVQRYDGYTTSEKANAMTFEFSGDDDVWIFVDDVLIGDVGGIHGAASISIDFSTGEIIVNENQSVAVTNGNQTTYESIQTTTSLYAQFQAAGETGSVDWTTSASGTQIFENNTYHTLKFYYLERGNGSSNMSLKSNLIEIPESSIYKVDQYGDPVEGATLAIYEAEKGDVQTDGEYTYYYVLDDNITYSDSTFTTVNSKTVEEATTVSSKLDSGVYEYDSSGNIAVAATGETIYTAKYTGTTNSSGKLVFQDKYSSAYTLNELKELIGSSYFIIREIEIPEGYRMVSEEIYMEITDAGLMTCNNTYTSGVYALPTEVVTATDRLYYSVYNATSQSTEVHSVLYNDITNDVVNGTLFAVVVKYTGEDLTAADWANQMASEQNWTPVYGSDDVGYTLQTVDYGSYSTVSEAFIAAAIAAAKEQSVYSDVIFESAGGTGAMQISLTCLPGDLATYYHILGDDEKENTQYTIAYYWTSASSLTAATSSNTYRVLSDSFTNRSVTDENGNTTTVSSYDGFDRIFGATINIPNLINRFFVQKLDTDGNLINGAYFAMYEVSEDSDGTIYYVADPTYTDSGGTQTSTGDILIYLEADEEYDGEADNKGRACLKGGLVTDGSYTVNETTGVITVTIGTSTYTITPRQVKETVTATDADNPSYEEGTACFTYMTEGTYYIREICAPGGYELNTTEIMVLVTEDAIYGNAGTSTDGVTVARGAGYLVSSLERFASEGEIDRTLSWIYEYLIINTNDIGTFAIGDPYDYDTDADWTKQSDISYLEYSPSYDQLDFVFDYVKNETRYDPTHAVDTRRLFSDEGWVALEIMQDYEYYLTYMSANPTATFNYDQITHSITHLFSRSLYIRVTDEAEQYDLEFMKVDGEDADTTDANDDRVLDTNTYTAVNDAEFTIYRRITETDTYGNVILDSAGNVQYIWSEYGTATSGSTGVDGLVIFKDLSPGYYMISETKTVGNYATATWDWYVTVTVDSDGDPTFTITSSVDTTAAGYFAYYTYSTTEASTAVDLNSLAWYTDASESGGYTTVQYYYWPNYDTLYDFEFYKINGDTITSSIVSGTDSSVLTALTGLTYLEDVDFTIYIKQLVTDGNGNALNASGAITTDPTEYQYEWVEYEYMTTRVQVYDSNGNAILDNNNQPTYATVNTAVSTSDSSGKVSFTGLPAGTYRIEESERVDGFKTVTWYWEVTIDDSGGITVSSASTTGGTLSTTELSLYTYTVTAGDGTGYDVGTLLYLWPNYAIDYELPSTGRFDIYVLTLGGILLMCFSAGFYIHGTYEERRRRRRPVSREKGS